MTPAGKRDDFIVHDEQPLNGEPPRSALVQQATTPVDAFYVRNHGRLPEVPRDAVLAVDGLVDRPLALSLDELRDGRFAEVELTATLQCAGNRREGLIAVRDIPGEAPWGPGATGTARWRGVRLGDVLAAAGVHAEATDVAFVGRDLSEEAEPTQAYGSSIPLRKARRPEVLLAWAMNDEALTPVHGAPLRMVVPGFIGARSVKWLERVEVRDAPWDGFYQATAYRLLEPGQEPAPGLGVPLGEVALNAEILTPDGGAPVAAGPVTVRGYAFAGGERHVARVDVSADGGATWSAAALDADQGRWAWRLWRTVLDLPPGEHELVVRAWDSAAALQPEHAASLWNPKGYVNNAWGRVTLRTA